MNRFELGMMGKVPQETTPKGEYEAPRDGANMENKETLESLKDQFVKFYYEANFPEDIQTSDKDQMESLKQKLLNLDPEFATYIERSENVNSDKFYASADAMIDYFKAHKLWEGLWS